MEFKGGELEEAPERSEFGSVGFFVPHRDKKLRSSSGPLTDGTTRDFLAEVIAELFPRVAPYAFRPPDFAFVRKRDRVTEGEIRTLLDATSKKRTALGPNGVHYWILGKFAEVMCARLSALYTARFRRALFPKQWKCANLVLLENREEIRRRQAHIDRFAFSTWRVSCSSV